MVAGNLTWRPHRSQNVEPRLVNILGLLCTTGIFIVFVQSTESTNSSEAEQRRLVIIFLLKYIFLLDRISISKAFHPVKIITQHYCPGN